jgi:hypothetical protein
VDWGSRTHPLKTIETNLIDEMLHYIHTGMHNAEGTDYNIMCSKSPNSHL